MQILTAASNLLKDSGIKAKIIKQYVPIINKFITKYLSAMDFFVQFELNEEFNETIKSRFRDDFSYASFSEGEKQKIDLALLFTWRAIAKLRNSVSTNLLIMDEVFDSSLDITATDYLMNIIRDVAKDSNIIVISHKEHMNEKFSNVIKFTKHKNFSAIQE
jgi:DNA repair exonuclease SbcCD ATPase subunit